MSVKHCHAGSFFRLHLYKEGLFKETDKRAEISLGAYIHTCRCTHKPYLMNIRSTITPSSAEQTTHFAVFCNTLFNADSSSVLEISVLDGVTELKEWHDIITQA